LITPSSNTGFSSVSGSVQVNYNANANSKVESGKMKIFGTPSISYNTNKITLNFSKTNLTLRNNKTYLHNFLTWEPQN
jgi:hypothetical protein